MNDENRDILPVHVKGRGDSLWVTLDPTLPLDYLQNQLEKVFARLKHLTVNARVVIDQGEEGSEHIFEHFCHFLKETFHVGFVSKAPAKIKETTRLNSVYPEKKMVKSWQNFSSDALIVSGRIRSGQKVVTRKHLIILGDVNPGAETIAGGDIHVFGALRGTAFAGQPGNEKTIILAMDFCPTQIQIGGYVAAGLPPSRHKGPEYAQVVNGSVLVKDYLKANPFGHLPTPQVR